MAPTTALLTALQWQFKFFDVTQVKLPDDESSYLSEVRIASIIHMTAGLHAEARKHNLGRLRLGKHLLWQRRWRRAHPLTGLQGCALVQGA